MRAFSAIKPGMSPDVLRKAILAAPKTHGWITRLAHKAGISRQRIAQIWKRMQGLCIICGRKAVKDRARCHSCGRQERNRNRRRDGYKGTRRGRERVYL